ncbi:MAG: hypothetical protein GF331_04425 [Chitinivibrionales bacterium]|nr:hypothetical protein [Chitinivibrionales bacterium]
MRHTTNSAMKYKRIVTCLLWCAAAKAVCFAADTAVYFDIPVGYAEAEAVVSVSELREDVHRYRSSIGFDMVFTWGARWPDYPGSYQGVGFAVFDTMEIAECGFRADDSIKIYSITSPTFAYGSADTVWEQATQMPAEFHSLDTVSEAGVTTGLEGPGKFCFLNIYNFGTQCWDMAVYDGYNMIMYARTNSGRCIKVQIADYSADTAFDTSTNCRDERVDGYTLRLAADSAGNGMFKHESAAAHRPAIFPRGSSPAYGVPVGASFVGSVFDLRGRPVARGGAGVYLTRGGRAVVLRSWLEKHSARQ